MNEPITIGTIGNYYGGLQVLAEGEHFYWGIENFNGIKWEEIPRNLYSALLAFELHRQIPEMRALKQTLEEKS
jgi:hypothetical protein